MDVLVDEAVQDIEFVEVVIIDGPAADVGAVGDVLDGEVVEAFLRHEPDEGVFDGVLCFLDPAVDLGHMGDSFSDVVQCGRIRAKTHKSRGFDH